VRFDPFDLLFGRLSFQGEVAIIGPLAIEIEPSWIWGTPSEELDEKGWALGANVGIYFDRPLRGFYLKGHIGYESFEATFTPDINFGGAPPPAGSVLSDTKRVQSAIAGLLIGSNTIIGPSGGRHGGFILSGGIGVGVALADPVELTVTVPGSDPFTRVYYDGIGKLQLMGSLGLGVAF
jgi:hypothetical protein